MKHEESVPRILTVWGPAAVWAAVLFLLSALPGVDDRIPILFPGEDKVAHFVLYAVLGACLAWGRRRGGSRLPVGVLLLLGVAYGASDEWHQAFVPGRDPSVGDWAADTLGVVLGYTIFSSILRRRGARNGSAGGA
ncbi:MAG: VanZ family protein [Gemmatimonadota bacterium]|jgi:VanZ family protein